MEFPRHNDEWRWRNAVLDELRAIRLALSAQQAPAPAPLPQTAPADTRRCDYCEGDIPADRYRYHAGACKQKQARNRR